MSPYKYEHLLTLNGARTVELYVRNNGLMRGLDLFIFDLYEDFFSKNSHYSSRCGLDTVKRLVKGMLDKAVFDEAGTYEKWVGSSEFQIRSELMQKRLDRLKARHPGLNAVSADLECRIREYQTSFIDNEGKPVPGAVAWLRERLQRNIPVYERMEHENR